MENHILQVYIIIYNLIGYFVFSLYKYTLSQGNLG